MKTFAELSASFTALVNELKALEKTMPDETESEIRRIDDRIEELEKEKCNTVAKFEEEFGKLTEMINAMQQVVGMSDFIDISPKDEPDRDRAEKEIPAESVAPAEPAEETKPVEPKKPAVDVVPCTDTPQTAVSKMKYILDEPFMESNKAAANVITAAPAEFLGKEIPEVDTPKPVELEQLKLPVDGTAAHEIKQSTPTHTFVDGKFITMDKSRHNMGDVIWIDWIPNIESDRYYYYLNRVWDGKTKTPAVAKVKDGVYQVMFETVSGTFIKIKYMELRKELVKRGAK